MKANLFYNHRLGDVLLISFDHNQEMTHFVKNNDTVIIYHNDQIIGVNIFNISSICKIRTNGKIHLPPLLLIEVLNNILKKHNIVIDEDNHSLFCIGQIENCLEVDNNYILNVNIGNKFINVKSDKSLSKGSFCVIGLEYAWLSSGEIIKAFNYQSYTIEGHLCSYKDLSLEDNDEIIILKDKVEIGQDFFSY